MTHTSCATEWTEDIRLNTSAGAPASAAPRMPTASMLQITQDIDGFFSDWTPRLRELLEHCRTIAEREEAVRQQQAELHEQRRAWEAQRQQEDEEIYETVQQLTEAWLRLESEQRVLVQAQESLQQRGHGQEAALRTLTREEGRAVARHANSVCSADQSQPVAEQPASLSRQMAVQQFERLKQELNQHMQTND